MRKFILIAVVVVGLIIIGYFIVRNSSSPKDTPEIPLASENSNGQHPDPANATFNFEDGPVTLSAGKNERTVAPGSAMIEETIILDKFAYGDINSDGKEDTVLFLARYGGGSGTFIYLAAFVSGPIIHRGSNAVFIGDRISPQSIAINKNLITVNYLGRTFDEPFTAEPTIPVTGQFIYKNGELQEK